MAQDAAGTRGATKGHGIAWQQPCQQPSSSKKSLPPCLFESCVATQRVVQNQRPNCLFRAGSAGWPARAGEAGLVVFPLQGAERWAHACCRSRLRPGCRSLDLEIAIELDVAWVEEDKNNRIEQVRNLTYMWRFHLEWRNDWLLEKRQKTVRMYIIYILSIFGQNLKTSQKSDS